MHRSYGLQGSLKRRYKHPSPTSINGYHTAKKLLSQSPAKRPTFAFADESGYTLAFANRIAHSGLHAETGAVSDGGAITTLGAFHTFRKPCVARCQNGKLCRFWVLVGGTPEGHREPTEQRCAYARRCSAGVAAPLGCVIFSVSVEIAACTHSALREKSRTRAHTPKQVAFWVGALSLPSTRAARSRTSPGRVSERQTLPLLGLGRGCSQRTQRAFGTAMRLCASLFRGVAAPLGCVIFFASAEVAACTPCAQSFLCVRGRGSITTLGALCMFSKRWTAACQKG